jgi:polyhydroxybutyrate depolymerase
MFRLLTNSVWSFRSVSFQKNYKINENKCLDFSSHRKVKGETKNSYVALLMGVFFIEALIGCSKNEQTPVDRRENSAQVDDQSREDKNKPDIKPQPKSDTPPPPPQEPEAQTPAPKKEYTVDDQGLPPIDVQGPIGGNRPVTVKTPVQMDAQNGKKYPLLLLLHGFSSDGEAQDRYLGLSRIALDRGYIFAAPNGTPTAGNVGRFWNASESCCNFTNNPVNDIVYLRDLIRQLIARYPVDPGRVYLFGHSNGAFMAHRLACEEAPRIAAIAALAGALRPRVEDCKPQVPVAVLTIHGTNDLTVRYEGGQVFPTVPAHPSALATIGHWAKVNGCAPEPQTGNRFSLLRADGSAETVPLVYQSCSPQGAAEHWRMDNGPHVPNFNDQFVTRVLDFFAKFERHTP